MSTDSSEPIDPDDEQSEAIAARLIDLPIEDELKDSYLTYAMSVIVSRALPDVRDGLKPSQRRILVAMNDLNLSPGASRVKCAKISGDNPLILSWTLRFCASHGFSPCWLTGGPGTFGSAFFPSTRAIPARVNTAPETNTTGRKKADRFGALFMGSSPVNPVIHSSTVTILCRDPG